MTHAYITREEIKRRTGDAVSTDDAAYRSAIEAVARAVDDPVLGCGRTFRVRQGSRLYTPEWADLLVVDDLISLDSLVTDEDGDGTYERTWDATDYALRPANAAADGKPYTSVALKPNGRYAFPCGVQDGAKPTGKWGWAEVLASAGTLGAAVLTTTATALTMAANHSVECGHTLLVDSEQMYVSNVSTNAVTVERGVNGTTAATHSNAAPVSVYRYPAGVVEASAILANRMFARKDAPFGVAGSQETGQITLVPRKDPDAWAYLAPFRRVVMGAV